MKTRRICVAAVIAVVAYAGTSQAGGGFSLRSLKGTYGVSGSGTLAGGAVQAAVVGLNSFDGAGGCGISARLNAGGTVYTLTSAECSYRVNRDGTGSLDVTFNEPPFTGPFLSDFVIVDEANELHFVLSDPSGGTVASGVSKRQSHRDDD